VNVVIAYNKSHLSPDHPDFSSERGVMDSVEAAAESLKNNGHSCQLLPIGSSLFDLVSELAGPPRPDVIVNLCEGFAGKAGLEPCVAALLELTAIPYTGSGPECLALSRNKPLTKLLLSANGLPTPWSRVVSANDHVPDEVWNEAFKNGLLFVKPAAEDASLGIDYTSVVKDLEQLKQKIDAVRRDYGDVLVEQFVAGREFNVSVVALPEPRVLPLAEIAFSKDLPPEKRIVTYKAKWVPGGKEDEATKPHFPGDVGPELAAELRRMALSAFRLSGCRDYARIDFRVDEQGCPFVLEVNANPDLGRSAGFARALKEAGTDLARFLFELVAFASSRKLPSDTPIACLAGGGRATGARQSSHAATTIRPMRPDDLSALKQILVDCRVFRDDEVQIGLEVLKDAAKDPSSGYVVRVAECDGRPVGWSCYGLVPLTDASYDLYWIAVSPEYQNHRIGRALLADVESGVAKAGGRWLLAETSDTPPYEPTRGFYLRTGYAVCEHLSDFYRPGDGRVTYAKRVRP
jgi:D-alanine-D-alanine ligase